MTCQGAGGTGCICVHPGLMGLFSLIGEIAAGYLRLDRVARGEFLARLSPEEAAALNADANELARRSLDGWCRVALAAEGQTPAAHHRLLIWELEEIADGENDRLMVMMPPGSAKSTYVSELFPPWFMRRERGLSVIGASHTSGLAEYFSRKVLGRIREHGDVLGIHLACGGMASWSTDTGGEYKAAGIGAAIAGRRADLAVIDDPIKSREAADSAEIRERIWAWYQGDLIGRLKPDGRIVLIMTRWHEDDLAGRLLEREPGRWRTVTLPAIAEEGDSLGRAVGEALWPEWEPLEKLLAKQTAVGGPDSREWNAQYQQRPTSPQGALFEVAKIVVQDEIPPLVRTVRAWDLAATEAGAVSGSGSRKKSRAGPDWTVGLLLGKTTLGRYVVLDVVRVRGGPEVVERTILETACSDGPGVAIGLPQDPGQAGKSQVSYLTAQLAGYVVSSSAESGSKATRAMPCRRNATMGIGDGSGGMEHGADR